MPNLTLSNDQVVELVKQLPQEQKTEIFRFLLLSQWQQWQDLSSTPVKVTFLLLSGKKPKGR